MRVNSSHHCVQSFLSFTTNLRPPQLLSSWTKAHVAFPNVHSGVIAQLLQDKLPPSPLTSFLSFLFQVKAWDYPQECRAGPHQKNWGQWKSRTQGRRSPSHRSWTTSSATKVGSSHSSWRVYRHVRAPTQQTGCERRLISWARRRQKAGAKTPRSSSHQHQHFGMGPCYSVYIANWLQTWPVCKRATSL